MNRLPAPHHSVSAPRHGQAMLDALRQGQMLARVEHNGHTYHLNDLTVMDYFRLLLGDEVDEADVETWAQAMAGELLQGDLPDINLDTAPRAVREIAQTSMNDFLHNHTVKRETLAYTLLRWLSKEE